MIVATLATISFLGAAALLLRLHLLGTGLSVVRDAVSDYGTTRFHRNYRAMVTCLGAGAVYLAIALARDPNATGLFWLWIYGVSRITIAAFMTDRDPPPFSVEGRIHWALAAAAFTAVAFAASDIIWQGAPGVLRPLGYAVAATAIATLLTRVIIPLRVVFGLAERLLYLTNIAWLTIAAVDTAA